MRFVALIETGRGGVQVKLAELTWPDIEALPRDLVVVVPLLRASSIVTICRFLPIR